VIFSNADVIRRVNADFVPVALKAGLVNNPPDDNEGRLYREIRRSQILPQGICVVNSAGKVLDWIFMFDDHQSVLTFLDQARKRFAAFPDAQKPFATERYMKFPSQKLAGIEDNGKIAPIVKRHAEGENCPAKPRVQQGTIIARAFGRALDKNGQPVADTVRQENYVEDRFNVPVARQEALAQALAAAGTERFKIADDLASLFVSHAFMGELDVNPFGGLNGSTCQRRDCTFWAQKVKSDANGPVRVQVQIEGESHVEGAARDAQNGGGPPWKHKVALAWEGLIEMKENRMTRLLLVARGTEKLQRVNKGQGLAQLPEGHAVFIDLDCGVRYGIIGEPVPNDEAGSADHDEVPDQARKILAENLHGLSLILRHKVQEDLKLTKEQEEKLEHHLPGLATEFFQTMDVLRDLTSEERDKKLGVYRKKAHEKLAAILKEMKLDQNQRKRLHELELQQLGLLDGDVIGKDLRVTDEQRQQFMGLVEDMQKRIEPLIKDAQSGGNPQEIWPMIKKIRKEHEVRLMALLTDAQKKRWKEMLGKSLDLGD
jgi:hypothetical protein